MSTNDIKTNKLRLSNAALLPEVIALVNEGHTVTLPLRGNSMRPFLEDGRDKALLKYPQKIKIGDVALAEIDHKLYVLHRVIAIKGSNVTLRGDGNINNEYCKLNDIKAIAIGFYRKGKSHLDSINDKKWKVYSWWWTHLYPLRRYLLYIYRHLIVQHTQKS